MIAAAVMNARRTMMNQSIDLRCESANLGDARAELLGDGEAAQERGSLLELLHHRIDGALAVAVHDAVESVEEMLFDRLVRRIADELLGHGPNPRGEVD